METPSLSLRSDRCLHIVQVTVAVLIDSFVTARSQAQEEREALEQQRQADRSIIANTLSEIAGGWEEGEMRGTICLIGNIAAHMRKLYYTLEDDTPPESLVVGLAAEAGIGTDPTSRPFTQWTRIHRDASAQTLL